jgi:hypothetical protein
MSMKSKAWVAAALITATVWSVSAHASTFAFNFGGPGVSGTLALTYEANPNTGPLPGTVPNPVDPVGSYVITNVTGVFSDATLGITNAVVTGPAPLNRVDPEPSNTLAPNSFSLLPVLHGVQGDGPLSPGLHYDNLLYPAGSPQAAADYPFSGGLFDIYGLLFKLDNGDYVNLWSSGAVPVVGLNYGVAVTDTIDALDYVSGVSITPVPEPATWALMIGGFGLAGAALRRRRTSSLALG